MQELFGVPRTAKDVGGLPTIEADNCVFHELAMKDPNVCRFQSKATSGRG